MRPEVPTPAKAFACVNRSFSSWIGTKVFLSLPRIIIAACFALAVFLVAAAAPSSPDPNDNGMDISVKPGDDFYRYANGDWLAKATLPAGQTNYGVGALLAAKTSQRVLDLVQDAATAHSARGSVAQKVGDYYASFMDEDGIDAKGLTPLADEMASIDAITDRALLSAYLGRTLASEVDGLTSNADHIFGVWINQGFEDSDHNLPHLWQGGLGLPDRDDYIDTSVKMDDLRAKYQGHVAAMLKLAGFANEKDRAAHVMALETRIAQAFAPDADAADVFKQNNPWKRSDFFVKAPGMDWDAYFKSAGLFRQSNFIVWQPSDVTAVSALVESEGLDTWKDYLRFHLIEHYACVLPKPIAAEDLAYRNEIVLQLPEKVWSRSESAIAAVNGALGQAVGQLYTQRYFPPDAKAKAQAMAQDLVTAYAARISSLTWMSPPTKTKALSKLAALEIDIGYPDSWIDYSTLDIVRGDAFGNMRRAEAFIHLRNLAKLGQPVDPIEWPINPQSPGAVIMFSPNAEFFSAGILQPPYFDSQGDSASNYGSAGAAMAHEISHSFDELGNIYDAHGRLGSWWTAEDRAQFRIAATKLAAQFSGYCPLSDACLKGEQVLTENVADLAGLLVAHDAYRLSLKGKPDVMIDGLSGDQRFFLAFAQRWRKIQSEAALRKQIATDTHAPGEYRSNTVRNVDAWYKAYRVTPSDKLYASPVDRVRIW
jgi:putative endopeptidase